MKKHVSLFIILLTIFTAKTLCGQDKAALESQAAQLHKSYKFDEAINIYKQLMEQSSDSLYKTEIEKKMILSENGRALLEFGSTPEFVAGTKVSAPDFFLHYPGFPDKSWVPLPKELSGQIREEDKTGFIPAVYFPEGATELVYSAPDNSGSWNIYTTHKINDTLWSAPVMLNENITSVGNELFPCLSPDGKTLYFSSNGHYGMGGYDLYFSKWDDEANDWGVAQNMGFPFSSVGNDLLFYNTPDGLYSVFASDRESEGEPQMELYTVNFENLPLKKNISPEDALNISLFKTKKQAEPQEGKQEGEQPGPSSEYNIAVTSVRKLQQDLKAALKQQQQNRELYNTLTNSDDLALLEKKIAEQETKTLTLQQELNTAMTNLQRVEMDFLSKGIIITEPQDKPENEGKEKPGHAFVFADNSLGTAPAMQVEEPEPVVDLSFKIADTAVIADINDFPGDLVYQIQLFVVSNKPSLKALKGLSPVFERKGSTGKYIYSAGTFNAYEEALKNLNKVRKLGFPSAIITAYNKGKSIPIKNARLLEQKEKESAVYQIIIEGFETLPADYVKSIRDNTEKDIAKTVENGATKYVVGPFTSKTEADTLKAALDKAGLTGIILEKIEKN